jgi:hypothetical protein
MNNRKEIIDKTIKEIEKAGFKYCKENIFPLSERGIMHKYNFIKDGILGRMWLIQNTSTSRVRLMPKFEIYIDEFKTKFVLDYEDITKENIEYLLKFFKQK